MEGERERGEDERRKEEKGNVISWENFPASRFRLFPQEPFPPPPSPPSSTAENPPRSANAVPARNKTKKKNTPPRRREPIKKLICLCAAVPISPGARGRGGGGN